MARLFVEFWQHECCGDLFEVGDSVVWPVTPVEGDGLVSLLGAELALRDSAQLRSIRRTQRYESLDAEPPGRSSPSGR